MWPIVFNERDDGISAAKVEIIPWYEGVYTFVILWCPENQRYIEGEGANTVLEAHENLLKATCEPLVEAVAELA